MANKGAWTNTPTGSGKVTIPAGYHNGNGYVDTSKSYTNGYNAGVTDSKPPKINGSFRFQAETVEKTSNITIPTSGYSTLTVTTSNYEAGTVQLIIDSSSGSKTLRHNGTATIDVSNDNTVTFRTYSSEPTSGTYVLTP